MLTSCEIQKWINRVLHFSAVLQKLVLKIEQTFKVISFEMDAATTSRHRETESPSEEDLEIFFSA